MTNISKRRVRAAKNDQIDFADIDFVATGLASTQEESHRINENRRIGRRIASEICELHPESDFATLPTPFKPIVALLLFAGADPGNFVLNSSNDSKIHLFGTVLSVDRSSWRIFHATSRVGDASDLDVTMNNVGTSAIHEDGMPFDTMEDAVEVLQQILELCCQDPDAIDRMEAGSQWKH